MLIRSILLVLWLVFGCLTAVRSEAAQPLESRSETERLQQGDPRAAASSALVERGRYLAVAGNCASCHQQGEDGPLAGGLAFETPFGTIHATNITPDVATGIGAWSAADFKAAMREGVRPGGEHLYPVFPYTAYTRLTDEDIGALFAYLQQLAPVAAEPPPNALSFPYNQRWLMGPWKLMFFEPGALEAEPTQSADWNRGRYLVDALGHCSACHTPRNALGAEQMAAAFTGGEYLDRVPDGRHRPWSAPDLTASPRGLALWSREELVAYLKTGSNSFLESFGPMNEVISNSTRWLSDADIDAMVEYLLSLPAAAAAAPATTAPDPQIMGRGRTVYNLHCGTCHLPTGEGDPEMAPRLNAGSLVVQSANPASMINVILYGPQLREPATATAAPRWRNPMEEYQYLLDDDEVAALATFVRHSWDNHAGVVTPEQVARQR